MQEIKPEEQETKIHSTAPGENFNDLLAEADLLINRADDDVNEDQLDYAALSKDEIVAKAADTLHLPDVKKANEILQKLRVALENLEAEERPAQIKAWVDAGHDARDFKPVADKAVQELNKIFHKFKEKREEERRRAEEEKLANLKRKENVLDRMKVLVENEENEHSLKAIRELMREWREIRHVPKEVQNDLYERYRFYLDKFYDNRSIHNELKEMDRDKNLGQKIELIKKVEALKEEPNIRKALISLHKFHEDWRNIGPVKQDISEKMWNLFKTASDNVVSDKKILQEKLDAIKQENLQLKTLLVAKAESVLLTAPQKLKDWNAGIKELDALMEEWKNIGPVPVERNIEIWNNFKSVRNKFFNARKEFFKEMNSGKEENLLKKIKLYEQAEKLKDAEDFNSTTEALNKLLEDWKKIGPVPEQKNDEIWKRFRASFDHFYSRKNAFYEQRRNQEAEAIKIKENVIKELEQLKEIEDPNAVFAMLKDAQMRWAKAGFVSGKAFYNLQKRYQDISDFLFKKFKRSSDEMKESVMKDHYETLSGAADGQQKMQFEERKVKERIQKLQSEKGIIENNLSFFKNAKNSEEIRKQFEANVQKIQTQIDRLEKELKVIRTLRNNAK
jgi:hypothetical protein